LSAVDALIHLCLHPALHHGYACSFIGYVDIDRLICQAGSDLFWTRLLERVRRFRVKTTVYWGLTAAHDLLATPMPAEVLADLAPQGVRLHLLRRLAPLNEEVVLPGAGRQLTGVRQVLLYVVLVDRLQDAWRMLWSILFPDLEWLAVRYALEGKGQARLYRLVHPFRVARAFLRGLYRPLVQSSLE
ncbi:MAG TPA: nucleotidyltransferase family protein, partial [Anaerolineae bacterium]|nr:nucleotidyltransferase family protein [Anaerolineae bacterium]